MSKYDRSDGLLEVIQTITNPITTVKEAYSQVHVAKEEGSSPSSREAGESEVEFLGLSLGVVGAVAAAGGFVAENMGAEMNGGLVKFGGLGMVAVGGVTLVLDKITDR